MKRAPLHFLGRKNKSLFDTNVKMKEMDNVELVLESSAIPESGTASVRARPTVKHHASSYDSFQGFAVPTPKVPLLPPVNGPKINGSVVSDQSSNGSVISMRDLDEEDIFVPPPPSVAPPPPPGTFSPPTGIIIPPPDFMGDLSTLDPSTLQPPPMPAPNPPSLSPSMQQEDLSFLQPPPMAPPKPPSTCSSGSSSSLPISTPPSIHVPDHPKFAPPQPPQKNFKMPPPKPIRLSSMSNLDAPPETPAPPPPVQTPTLSTFNPQHTAKLYDDPSVSALKGHEESDIRPKHKLLLEDSSPIKPAPVLAKVDGKAPQVSIPSKPVSKDVREIKEGLQVTQLPNSPSPQPNKEAKTATVSVPPIEKPLRNSTQTSPLLRNDKLGVSPSPNYKVSPILDRKLRNLKSSETHGAKEGHAASPLALLMAAKKREKERTSHSLSRENSGKKDEPPSVSILPSDSSPNSFTVTPRSSSSSSLVSQDPVQESPKSVRPVYQTPQTPEKSRSPALVRGQIQATRPGFSSVDGSPSLANMVLQKQNTSSSPSTSHSSTNGESKAELNLPLLPPPPEFDDFDVGPPPSTLPPDPPRKVAPMPTLNSLPVAPTLKPPPVVPPPVVPPPVAPPPMAPPPKAPPIVTPPPVAPPLVAPSSKPPPVAQAPVLPPPPKPPQAPKLPPPDTEVKPKFQVQPKPKMVPNQLPPNLSPSQVTLLSILQKKMAEMDHKMAPVKEPEPSSDDWGSTLPDEDNKSPFVPKTTAPKKTNHVVNKPAAVDMRELEGKLVRKHQETSSVKSPTSNGLHSKHQYGMTFTIRPGTKNPITLYNKEES